MKAKFGLSALAALLALTASLVATPASAHGSEDDDRPPAEYVIVFENLTGGQPLTPPNFAAHDDEVDIFSRGEEASAALQALAENGGSAVLEAELKATIDDMGYGTSGVGGSAPVAPGHSVSFTVTSDERYLSIAAMLVCTNDGFAGLDTKRLPRRIGRTKTFRLKAYDAGTEINTEARPDLVPVPLCDGDFGPGGTGESNPLLAEEGEIRRHRTIRGIGDLGPEYDWRGRVAKVTVTRVG